MQDVSERAALIPGGLSDGQFYSPPESEAGKKFDYHLYFVHYSEAQLALSSSLSLPLLLKALSKHFTYEAFWI